MKMKKISALLKLSILYTMLIFLLAAKGIWCLGEFMSINRAKEVLHSVDPKEQSKKLSHYMHAKYMGKWEIADEHIVIWGRSKGLFAGVMHGLRTEKYSYHMGTFTVNLKDERKVNASFSDKLRDLKVINGDESYLIEYIDSSYIKNKEMEEELRITTEDVIKEVREAQEDLLESLNKLCHNEWELIRAKLIRRVKIGIILWLITILQYIYRKYKSSQKTKKNSVLLKLSILYTMIILLLMIEGTRCLGEFMSINRAKKMLYSEDQEDQLNKLRYYRHTKYEEKWRIIDENIRIRGTSEFLSGELMYGIAIKNYSYHQGILTVYLNDEMRVNASFSDKRPDLQVINGDKSYTIEYINGSHIKNKEMEEELRITTEDMVKEVREAKEDLFDSLNKLCHNEWELIWAKLIRSVKIGIVLWVITILQYIYRHRKYKLGQISLEDELWAESSFK